MPDAMEMKFKRNCIGGRGRQSKAIRDDWPGHHPALCSSFELINNSFADNSEGTPEDRYSTT